MLKKMLGLMLLAALGFLLVGCGSTSSSSSSLGSGDATTLKITNVSPYAIDSSSAASVIAAVRAMDLPSDLELNVTFDYFKVSPDGSSWSSLTTDPVTVNLLDTTTMTTSGASATISAPAEGYTYKYLGMGVSAIEFSQGGETRDMLAMLKAQSGGEEDWDNITMPIIPFTYTSGELQLNMYMPPSNITGSSFDTYFPAEGPIFNFTGGGVSSSEAGTFSVTISSGVSPDATVLIAAFQNIEQDSAPYFTGVLTNNGAGGASGTLNVAAGSWYLMAIATTQEVGTNGPESGVMFTVGGADPWAADASTATGGETTAVTLAQSSADFSEGGSGQAPSGTASMIFAVGSYDTITLSSGAELMLYSFESLDSYQAGGPPAYFLASRHIDAGAFGEVTCEASGLAAGTYVVIAHLDTNSDGMPDSGDYMGMYGATEDSPHDAEEITLASGEAQDLSGSPIYLGPASEE